MHIHLDYFFQAVFLLSVPVVTFMWAMAVLAIQPHMKLNLFDLPGNKVIVMFTLWFTIFTPLVSELLHRVAA